MYNRDTLTEYVFTTHYSSLALHRVYFFPMLPRCVHVYVLVDRACLLSRLTPRSVELD